MLDELRQKTTASQAPMEAGPKVVALANAKNELVLERIRQRLRGANEAVRAQKIPRVSGLLCIDDKYREYDLNLEKYIGKLPHAYSCFIFFGSLLI